MVNRYSLADHTVVVTMPTITNIPGLDSISGKQLYFGGPGQNNLDGSFMGSISVSRANDTWSTEGDSTGSWVHNKNLNRTGSVQMTIRQVSDDIIYLMMIAQMFENYHISQGMDIEIFNGDLTVARAEDCYLTKIPDQIYGESAATQDWVWTSGRVTFPQTKSWNSQGSRVN